MVCTLRCMTNSKAPTEAAYLDSSNIGPWLSKAELA